MRIFTFTHTHMHICAVKHENVPVQNEKYACHPSFLNTWQLSPRKEQSGRHLYLFSKKLRAKLEGHRNHRISIFTFNGVFNEALLLKLYKLP